MNAFALASPPSPDTCQGVVLPLEPPELTSWLEWAGSKLLSLSVKSPFPAGYRSNMPHYVPDRWDYGKERERFKPARPTSEDIGLMDEILLLPGKITDHNQRFLVNARALVRPVARTYLYSWTKLAIKLHTDRRKVVRLHHQGLRQIIAKLPTEQVYTFRKTLSPLLQ